MKLIVVCCSALALLVAAPAAGAAVVPSPVTSLTSGPAGLGNDATPSFTFSSDRELSTFDCRFAGSAAEGWSASGAFGCGSGEASDPVTWTSSGLADATWHFQVRACAIIDTGSEYVEKCDQSPAKRTFTIDTVAPPVDQWSVAPGGARVDEQVVIRFGSSEPGAVFRCRLDTAEPKPCTDVFYGTGVADGPHTMSVQAGDAVGNWSAPRTHAFVHDSTAPRITLSGPGDTQDRTPTWTWDAPPDGGAPYVVGCMLDDGNGPSQWIQDCAGTTWTPGGPLPDGVYELTVTLHDEAGNSASETLAVRVDTTPPAIDVVWEAEAKRIVITTEFVALECKFDAMDPWACGPNVDGGALAPGAHTFTVRAIDLAGNESTKTIGFTIQGEPTDPGTGGGDPTDPTDPPDPGNGAGGGLEGGGTPVRPATGPGPSGPTPAGRPLSPSGDAPRPATTPTPLAGAPAEPPKAKAKKRCATKRKLAKRAGKKRAKRRPSCSAKAKSRRRALKRAAGAP